jgi:glutamate dehydrogenase (NADP+)
VLDQLAVPQRVARVAIPVRMDDGSQRVFQGLRLVLSDALGPTKGGLRVHPAVSEGELGGLGFRILVKCAVNGLPHGGAGGGIAADARALSRGEFERLCRGYVRALFGLLGPQRDILSPDLYTDATVMGWLSDEYDRLAGMKVPAAINGKKPGRGGIHGRHGATARGAWSVLSDVLRRDGVDPSSLTYAIQGFGAAGGTLASLLVSNGARVVAAGDTSATLRCAAGLDVESLLAARGAGKSLRAAAPAGVDVLEPGAVLEAAADVLVPAAVADVLTARNVERVRARYVLEVANGPVDADAEAALEARGVTVIPDVVANAGGITVSHFEWCQGLGGQLWQQSDVHARLDACMRETARAMIEIAAQERVTLAVAAQLRAIDRIAVAMGA